MNRVDLPASIRAIHEQAEKKRALGAVVFDFSAGEPRLPVDPVIERGVLEAMDQAQSIVSYAPVAGLSELREEAASWIRREYQASYSAKETIVTAGGKFAVYALMQSLLGSLDEVLLPVPYWPSYPEIARLCGASVKAIVSSQRRCWKVTSEDLDRHATAKTKLLILNNGQNPTGTLYTEQELESLLQWAKQRGIVVLSDEVYSEIVYDHKHYVSCSSFHEYRDNVAIVQSCSKNFGLTGWRVGFAFAPRHLIDALITLQGASTSGASTIGQWAALVALRNAERISGRVSNEMCKRRDLFVSTFESLFHETLSPASSAIYQFISMEQLGISSRDSIAFCQSLMEEVSVMVAPGRLFGAEGYVRFAFSEECRKIEEGLLALYNYCRRKKS